MADTSYLYKLRSSPLFFGILGLIALLFLVLSYLIKVRIILESPAYGDVTGVVGAVWSICLGIATIGSFMLAIHNFRRGTDSDGPATDFSIEGENHDIDVHLHVNENQENEGGSLQPETERDESQESDNS